MTGETILVVEDDDDVQQILCALLESTGYETVCADNGAKALVAVRRTRPAVIVLDLMMPLMSGWEVLDRLRSDPQLSTIPVIVVTAGMQTPDNAYVLRKPFGAADLLHAVESARANAPPPPPLPSPPRTSPGEGQSDESDPAGR